MNVYVAKKTADHLMHCGLLLPHDRPKSHTNLFITSSLLLLHAHAFFSQPFTPSLRNHPLAVQCVVASRPTRRVAQVLHALRLTIHA